MAAVPAGAAGTAAEVFVPAHPAAVAAPPSALRPAAAAPTAAVAAASNPAHAPTPGAAAAVAAKPLSPPAAAVAAPAATGSTSLQPFVLPVCSSVLAVQATLWDLADHLQLPDSQLEQLSDAVERLISAEGEGKEPQMLARFKGDYAALCAWASRGRVDRARKAVGVLVQNALR